MFLWIEQQPDLEKVDLCIANAGLVINAPLMKGNLAKERTIMYMKVSTFC